QVKVCSFIIPWFHFFLLQLCVQRLGSLLPVKIPILSSVLVLQVNSLILYQAFLLYQNKRLNFDEELQYYTWKLLLEVKKINKKLRDCNQISTLIFLSARF
uniref:Uncharacterized protein n=1 Tax=Terrapene triunguis TaxID=2587831 RepID=A0A674KFX6_9SAUR